MIINAINGNLWALRPYGPATQLSLNQHVPGITRPEPIRGTDYYLKVCLERPIVRALERHDFGKPVDIYICEDVFNHITALRRLERGLS